MARIEQDALLVKPGRTDYLTDHCEYGTGLTHGVTFSRGEHAAHELAVLRHTSPQYIGELRSVTVVLRVGPVHSQTYYTPDEARRIARALMRAADDAEAAAQQQAA